MRRYPNLPAAFVAAMLCMVALSGTTASAVVLMDSEGVVWDVSVIARDAYAIYMLGTADMGGGDIRVATATRLLSTGQITMCAGPGDTGRGAGFTQNLVWEGGSGKGVWMAWDSSGYHGLTTVWRLDSKAEASRPASGGKDPLR